MSINIPSTILIDALNYVHNNEASAPWFAARNISKKVSARSMKAEVYAVNTRTRVIYIRVYVDYTEMSPDVGQIEDLIINLAWHKGEFSLGRSGSVSGF